MKWKCNDFKCVRKPTSRLSLTHHTNKSSHWADLFNKNIKWHETVNSPVGSGVASYWALSTISFLVHFGVNLRANYCVVCEISWCRCQQLTALSISTALLTAVPGPEVRRECPMSKFTALSILATNPGDATAGRKGRWFAEKPIMLIKRVYVLLCFFAVSFLLLFLHVFLVYELMINKK